VGQDRLQGTELKISGDGAVETETLSDYLVMVIFALVAVCFIRWVFIEYPCAVDDDAPYRDSEIVSGPSA
jgi:hypothetical protein